VKIVQCLLKNGALWSVRWVSTKKAIEGNKITALGFDEITVKEWIVDTVYWLEQDDQYYFHVVK